MDEYDLNNWIEKQYTSGKSSLYDSYNFGGNSHQRRLQGRLQERLQGRLQRRSENGVQPTISELTDSIIGRPRGEITSIPTAGIYGQDRSNLGLSIIRQSQYRPNWTFYDPDDSS